MNPWARWRERKRLDRELADEMAAHLEEHADALQEQGYCADQARELARQRFGNLTLQQENSRDAWGWTGAGQLAQDLRYGVRTLRKTPAFTLTAVAVLALGIGMNTAMFSAVKAVLLSALPYPDPDRIVAVWQTSKTNRNMHVSRLDFEDWRAQSRSFQNLATYQGGEATLLGSFAARRVRMASVGLGFFEALGTRAAVGSVFGPAEQKPGGGPTAVLGYELTRNLFGQLTNVIGRTVRLNGMEFTVIGVMPPKFDFPFRAEIWLPNDFFSDQSTRSAHNYYVIGRLRPEATLQQAKADMNIVAARLAQQYADDKDEGIRLVPLYEQLVGSERSTLLVLQGAVALVLLIACANISSLQLARGAARIKELGLRSALGAGRWRLIRQLLTESVVLSAIGGVAGLLVALQGTALLRRSVPGNIPRLTDVAIDPVVLGFTAAVSILVGLLSGVLPALQTSKADTHNAIKEGAGKGASATHSRFGKTLVAAQVALAIVLLSGAALLLKSYWRLASEDTGLRSAGVLISDLTWPASADGNSVDAAFVQLAGRQTLAQIGKLPGVSAVALINGLPFQGAPDGNFEIEGRPLPADPHMAPDADYRMATAGYFKAFELPILQGRNFTEADDRTPEQVAIVNQAFVKEFFSGAGAVGKRIRFFGMDPKPRFMTIVGVVRDARDLELSRRAQAEVFVDYFQHADTRMDATLIVRGPAANEPEMKRIVTSLNHDTAVNFQDMDGFIFGTIARQRFQTGLLTLFAACALLLAVVGVYGLLSYIVTRRTSELGIRMALGADRHAIQKLVLGQGGILILAGVALGLVGALTATRLLQAMLYRVTASDPAALGAVAVGFCVAGMLGCYLPARRASQLDPASSMRQET